jgi:predicted ATPase
MENTENRYNAGETFLDVYLRRKKQVGIITDATPEQKAAQVEYFQRLCEDVPSLSLCTLKQAKLYMWQRFKELHPNRQFSPNELYPVLSYYASQDDVFLVAKTANDADCSFAKGIAIVGSYGVGKSTLLKCIKQMPKGCGLYLHNGYTHYLDASQFATDYQESGIEAFDRWRNKEVLFIDDVGEEPQVKYYGNGYPIVAQLLKYRYEKRLVTHITSNKSPAELGTLYGEGVKDRLKEMFNFFWWGGDSKR